MNESTNKRTYQSPRREEQARETRERILAAAQRLFGSDGYVATTLPTLAREAGVSPATITAIFGTKLALLNALVRATVRGDSGPEPLDRRPWWRNMLSEPDPARQLALFAAINRRIHERTTDIADIVRGAASAEPELAALRQALGESRLQDNREVAVSLAGKGALAPGVTVEYARDLLWTLGSSEVYRMLVHERGWSPEQYEQWLVSSLADSLLAGEKRG
ncbi:MAG: TetR/AcrR family transcriptional regulator [Chloroflexi bacterium]|nr:TetR/AcrR family transcriptional regulator [Chloroflexota bacterium]